MTALPVPEDAELAVAAGHGDTTALAAIYDRYSGRLLGFCRSMLRSQTDAEDCLQDVFVIAATRLKDLREPPLLRSWLFSIARHECLGRIDKRHREVLMDDVPDHAAVTTDPVVSSTLDSELASLLRDATAGLSDRDRLLLELADRQQLSGDELARAVGVPRSTAYTLVARARATAKKSIGALLVARTGRQQCPQLDAMLTGWDGTLTTLRRKQITRHVESCEICEQQRDRVATPAALLGEGEAFAAQPVGLRTRILAAAAAAGAASTGPADGTGPATGTGTGTGTGTWVDGWPPADFDIPRRRRRAALIALVVLIAALISVSTLALANRSPSVVAASGSIKITDATTAAPTPADTASTIPAPTTAPTTASTTTPRKLPTAIRLPSSSVQSTPVDQSSDTNPTPNPTPTTLSAPSSPRATRVPPDDVLTLTTAPDTAQAVTVRYGTTSTSCAAGDTTCTYSIVPDTEVTIYAPRRPPEVFSAPAGCGSADPCSFVMTSNLTIVLSTA